ncbi:MAG: hypothetical protein RL514_1607 [Verrucomicrobiota bacterium]|jgi:Rod binding domain-containing protein
MELTALPTRTAPANLSLERLAANQSLTEKEKVGEAGRQFEAVLLRQILGEAMKPVFKSEFTSQSAQAGIYQDMVVNQMADNVTRAGGLGLATSLNRDLTRQLSSALKPSAPLAHD